MNAATKPNQAPAKIDPSSNMLAIIATAASDPRVDVTKMTALLEMQEKLLAREAQGEFNTALARMNTDDLRVTKNGMVSVPGKVSYKFAKWEDMDRIIRPLMQREGFTLSFDTAPNPTGGIIVIGELLHEGGHSRSARIPLTLDTGPGRNALQAMGSTVSYGKRYVTEMLLNIVREDEDDDGQSAAAPYRRDTGPRVGGAAHDPTAGMNREEQRANGFIPDPPPKPRTGRDVINEIKTQLDRAGEDLAAVEAVAASDLVQKALGWLKNGGLDELNAILNEAIERGVKAQEEAGQSESGLDADFDETGAPY